MKWVTRKNAKVDRIACPWLIRRFIDKDAQFLFVPPDQVREVAEREQAIPFDVQGVEVGHVDGRCSFESLMLKYNLTDPALRRLAEIVHGGDVPADIDIIPEAAGLEAIAHGFAWPVGSTTTRRSASRVPSTTRYTSGASSTWLRSGSDTWH